MPGGGMGWTGGMSMPSIGWTPYGGMGGLANMPGGIQSMAEPLIAAAQGAQRGDSGGSNNAIPMAMKIAQRNRPEGGMQAGGRAAPAVNAVGRSPIEMARAAPPHQHELPEHLQEFPRPDEPGLTSPDAPLYKILGLPMPKTLPEPTYHPKAGEYTFEPLHQSYDRVNPEEGENEATFADFLKESFHQWLDQQKLTTNQSRQRRGLTPKRRRGGRIKRALSVAKRQHD